MLLRLLLLHELLIFLFCTDSHRCKTFYVCKLRTFQRKHDTDISTFHMKAERTQQLTLQILLSGPWIARCLSYYSNIVTNALMLSQMKLEKKRSSSMDKIMNKLRSAQKRAQEMRSSVLVNQAHQVTRTSHKAVLFRRTRQMGSLSGCFTCHAF